MADLVDELRELMKVAKRENYTEAQKVLAGHLKEIRDERLRRPWPLGRCVWCEIDANRLREAVEPDPGGGPATCFQHAEDYYAAIESQPPRHPAGAYIPDDEEDIPPSEIVRRAQKGVVTDA